MGSKGGKGSKSNRMRVRERVEAVREGEMPTGRRERRGGEQKTWIPETRSAFSLAQILSPFLTRALVSSCPSKLQGSMEEKSAKDE